MTGAGILPLPPWHSKIQSRYREERRSKKGFRSRDVVFLCLHHEFISWRREGGSGQRIEEISVLVELDLF